MAQRHGPAARAAALATHGRWPGVPVHVCAIVGRGTTAAVLLPSSPLLLGSGLTLHVGLIRFLPRRPRPGGETDGGAKSCLLLEASRPPQILLRCCAPARPQQQARTCMCVRPTRWAQGRRWQLAAAAAAAAAFTPALQVRLWAHASGSPAPRQAAAISPFGCAAAATPRTPGTPPRIRRIPGSGPP